MNEEQFSEKIKEIFSDIVTDEKLSEQILDLKYSDFKSSKEAFESMLTALNKVVLNPLGISSVTPSDDTEEDDTELDTSGNANQRLVRVAKKILDLEGVKGVEDNKAISEARKVFNKKFGKNAWNIDKLYSKNKLLKI